MKPLIKLIVLAAAAVTAATTAVVAGASPAAAEDYGPDTCLQGYVWRDATDGDHVCVIPATRSQAHSDNGEADNRRATLKLWISRWYPPSDCGDDCTSSDSDVARIQVNGDHFNVGRVWIGTYRRSNGRLIEGSWVNATRHSGFVVGSFRHKTNNLHCDSGTETRYIRAYDKTSQRWSPKLSIRTGCVHP